MYRSANCSCNMPNRNAYSNYGYRANTTSKNNATGYYDERGFWIPFVVGGNI